MDIQSEKLHILKLLLETENERVIKKVKQLLTPRSAPDETEYLSSSPRMEKILNESIEEINQGKVKVISLDEVWK